MPPLLAAVVTANDRDCVPPPHASLQLAHEPQLPSQFTAHPCVLHDCDCDVGDGQALPPLLAAVVTAYDRDCVPPPHASLQLAHEPQLPAQFTGLAACAVIVNGCATMTLPYPDA